ncbi:MAG: Ger(x)C family spore germination protein [Oscillospiraceae bacterium]
MQALYLKKKLLCVAAVLLMMLPLTGCWSYVGLNEIAIVYGVAVDKNDDGTYHMSFESSDLTAVGTGKSTTVLIEGDGVTIHDAVRNAMLNTKSTLYFGNCDILIISSRIAAQDGLRSVMDFFYKNTGIRETNLLSISKMETAKEVLGAYMQTPHIASTDIYTQIIEDNQATCTLLVTRIFEFYNLMQLDGQQSVGLPGLVTVVKDNKKIIELDGTVVLKDDKLAGYLTPLQGRMVMLARGECKGGMLSFKTDALTGKEENVSVGIRGCQAKISFTDHDGIPDFHIKVKAKVYLIEGAIPAGTKMTDCISTVKKLTEAYINTNLEHTARYLFDDLNCDVIGLGADIYRHDFHYWYDLRDNWSALMNRIPVTVDSDVTVLSTGKSKSFY